MKYFVQKYWGWLLAGAVVIIAIIITKRNSVLKENNAKADCKAKGSCYGWVTDKAYQAGGYCTKNPFDASCVGENNIIPVSPNTVSTPNIPTILPTPTPTINPNSGGR